MNKLTRTIKLGFVISLLAIQPFVNATKNNFPVTVDDAKSFIEDADITTKELIDTTNLAMFIRDRFTSLDTENHLAITLKYRLGFGEEPLVHFNMPIHLITCRQLTC